MKTTQMILQAHAFASYEYYLCIENVWKRWAMDWSEDRTSNLLDPLRLVLRSQSFAIIISLDSSADLPRTQTYRAMVALTAGLIQ